MFRRLAEALSATENFDGTLVASDPHADYINKQSTYFDTLPNIIPSATSGLQGFDKAIQSVDTLGNGIQQHAVKRPNDIFRPDLSPSLAKLASDCATSTIDELIAMKNPAVGMGCGWMYTPPNRGSPYPLLSKGVIGSSKAPMPGFDNVSYKKYFFDLQEAKKVALMDKCKAMKACTDTDQEVFKGMCGYCTDTNQGVPIDNVGRALYPNDPMSKCTPGSIITSSDKCPKPNIQGPQPVIDRTCDPVNGRLSSACLHRQVLSAGCTDAGSLAIALNGSPPPNNFVQNIQDGDAVKLYNRAANPPLNLDIFRQGQATVNQILQEVRQIAGNTAQPSNSALGAGARDLCLQRGAVRGYDSCANLPDGQPAPFELACLQQIFLKMGGQPAGSAYPQASNINEYNNMGTLGRVKQYWNELIAKMKRSDGFSDFDGHRLLEGFANSYDSQSDALVKVLGISPEKGIKRAPYSQGIEVFWFVLVPGPQGANRTVGFLKRTIERDWVQLAAGPSRISQLGGIPFGCMVQMTDVRVQNDTSVKYRVQVDDGFWIATNQPANIDQRAMSAVWNSFDEPGLFESLGYQGPTWYNSNAATTYRANKPNITKIFFEDAGGGWNALQIVLTPTFSPTLYSLTCEPNAPMLNYEVWEKSGTWVELRNPGLFGQFLSAQNPDYHMRTDERTSVPGKKSFVRLNGANSYINTPNIAFSSWKTMTFAVRLQSMPVRETLAHLFMGTAGGQVYNPYFAIIATPINGSTAGIIIDQNLIGHSDVSTPFRLELGVWYMFVINNRRSSFDIYCNSIDGFLAQNGSAGKVTVTADGGRNAWDQNCTWNPTPGLPWSPCNIAFSGGLNRGQWWGMFGSSSFTWDLAWVHFFDKEATNKEIIRECKCDWIYTQFPDSFDNYKTLSA